MMKISMYCSHPSRPLKLFFFLTIPIAKNATAIIRHIYFVIITCIHTYEKHEEHNKKKKSNEIMWHRRRRRKKKWLTSDLDQKEKKFSSHIILEIAEDMYIKLSNKWRNKLKLSIIKSMIEQTRIFYSI